MFRVKKKAYRSTGENFFFEFSSIKHFITGKKIARPCKIVAKYRTPSKMPDWV